MLFASARLTWDFCRSVLKDDEFIVVFGVLTRYAPWSNIHPVGLVEQLRSRAAERVLEEHVERRLDGWHAWVAAQPPRIAVTRRPRYPYVWLERTLRLGDAPDVVELESRR